MIDRRRFGLGALAAPALALPVLAATGKSGARPGPFMLGADVTWIAEDEAAGAEYFVDGVKKDPFAILTGAGFNYVRLRTFVNPENGYSRREPENKWGGLEQTLKLARRVKDAGMGLALSFHYSDTWADPEHQAPPAAWANMNLAEMANALHDYTKANIAALKAAGTPVDMAVIGNETTFGMLWPKGRVPFTVPTGNATTDANHKQVTDAGGFDGFATLLKAGIIGAKSADPKVKIQIHNHLGRHWPIVQNWTDELLKRGVDFDVLGLSCYQQAAEGDWKRTLDGFAKRYPGKGVLAAEYSSRKRYVNDLFHDVPDNRGWGTFIWEPTRHQEAIFDQNGRSAGEGARPNLLSQVANPAEAPGGTPPRAAPTAPRPTPPAGPRRMGRGGRYDANALLGEYRKIAADYGLKRG
jgi:arabinogalactan endo-1,4-beta-galactosidase